MKYSVNVAPRADRDITEIADWITARSAAGARAWLDALLAAFDRHEMNPVGYPLATESAFITTEIREFSFKTRRGRACRGVFRVVDRTVHVLHIRGPGQPLLRPEDFEE